MTLPTFDQNGNFLFNENEYLLVFDYQKQILICKEKKFPYSKKWIKKLDYIFSVEEILEDDNAYYLRGEYDENQGRFLAIAKVDGQTLWFIPGYSFLQILYCGFLYLIFIDENEHYFLLKIDTEDGTTIWFYEVDNSLVSYNFSDNLVLLQYSDGKEEILDTISGNLLYT